MLSKIVALSDCHTLPDSTNGRVTDSKILCPFVSPHMRFLSVPHAMNAFRVRWYPFFPLACFGHVQNFELTPRDKNMYGGWMLPMPWYAVCPVLVQFFLSSCLQHPVSIHWCPFGLSCEQSTSGQVKEFPVWLPHAHSVIVQRTLFCPFLIHNIFVLSVIHLLHVR